MARHTRFSHYLERFSARVTAWTGGSWGFGVAVAVVLVWLATGPIFNYSDTWQLIINTGTTIVTFLMVFLIQRSQNKDALALQLKLNELVAAMKGASNRLIDVEDLDEDELRILHRHYRTLAKLAKRDARLTESHSIEEAETRHGAKRSRG
jgi:low affinity Fe/Cu permease